ncbi:hypothetical protein [Neomoorella humiferrea]|uniref:hypothetical protein n=1 Tax=Neomoorella humiferrea TaxID=676965 RepID=UPI0011B2649E|nr:hypothetical protein [Moorella humiferrea]
MPVDSHGFYAGRYSHRGVLFVVERPGFRVKTVVVRKVIQVILPSLQFDDVNIALAGNPAAILFGMRACQDSVGAPTQIGIKKYNLI